MRVRGIPFGYRRDGGRLLLHPVEAPVRQQVYELFLKHGRKKAVAKLLNDAGHRTRDGSLFSGTAIGRLIEEPGVTGTEMMEPLVSKDVWERCCAMLNDHERVVSKRPAHLFAGIAECACGEKMYVPSSNPVKYVCAKCQNKIPIRDLEDIFYEQLKSFFLVPIKIGTDGQERSELVQVWPELMFEEKRSIVENITDSIIIGDGKIRINLCLLPSAEYAAKREQEQKGNTKQGSPTGHVVPLKINIAARELWDGNVSLTHLLTETTKNFLAVLGLNVANRVNAPLDPNMPFADDATATAKSALDMLRRQIGTERCQRLFQLERRRGDKPGGIKLANVQVVGTGRRDVVSLTAVENE